MNTLLTNIISILGLIVSTMTIYQIIHNRKKQRKEDYDDNFVKIRRNVVSNRLGIYRFRLKSKFLSKKFKIDDLPLLSLNNSILKEPVNIDEINLSMASDIEPKLGKYRIRFGSYDKYSSAIMSKDKPNSFFSGRQYRLLDVDKKNLIFSCEEYKYFDKIDFGASLVYESSKDFKKNKTPFFSKYKKIIKKIEKPSDYIILTGIDTLTLLINKNNDVRMIMHLRGEAETAYASGTFHVIPAGEFQPSCYLPYSWEDDFSITKNIMREFSEEIENKEEYNGESGVPFNYNQEPFISMINAKSEGKFKLYYLGTGFDALSLQGEILTCAVFDEDTFHKIFPNVITKNKEGEIMTDRNRWGRPFDKEVESYLKTNTLAACETILKLVKRNLSFFVSEIVH
ncbi:hypothetical protein [Saccharicrinis sp. FJH54]|uniref:hypothetical protein n=1 Tax=Saccharicrinis sp. FJH54 TaxID=3344665 RepID=UPI0035D44139